MRTQNNYNPDVLSCLANLSNDEVFTPPDLANQMLDMLPTEIWHNPDAKFLDPFCKSGVFLREIAKRLLQGLEDFEPDLQKRIDHIMQHQIYGIGITELTALLARRTLYCSKSANGQYAVANIFDTTEGHIAYDRTAHTFENGKCTFCGASEAVYDRGDDLETHAYQFIHDQNPFKDMQFDVIIGNPPYQLNDGGGTGSSAKPIYQKFVQQAKRLNPKYLLMIIPARWYSGGKGLDNFREDMLGDKRLKILVDYEDSRDCFPGVDIAGGICYFLWESSHKGVCEVKTVRKNIVATAHRKLDEFETFVRNNMAVKIIHKVKEQSNSFMDNIVSSRMPFGIVSNEKVDQVGDLILISSTGEGRIPTNKVTNGKNLIDKWKVLLSKTSNDHAGQPDKEGKRRIFSRIAIMPPKTVCTESYLVVGNYTTEQEAQNMITYLKTNLVRFLVSTILLTQNITKSKFVFVPNLSMNLPWTDEKLYKKYGLTAEEINFIESMIKPMA